MNRITILCRKAEELVPKVVFEGENELEKEGIVIRKSYFTFKDIKNPPSITITCNGRFTFLENCTCSQHTINGPLPEVNMKNLCSYVLAVYKSLGVKNENLKNK